MSELMKLYGRLRGRKLRDTPQHLMDELLPQVRLNLPEDGTIAIGTQPLWLEVGFGAGEHIHGQALNHPDIQFIGCEAYINGVSGLLQHMHNQPTPNLRIFPQDARLLINRLPDACTDRVYVLFPDPWPKKRHFKRRLLSDSFIQTLARIIKPGGELRIATDDDSYAEWIEERLGRQTFFEGPVGDIHTPPADWIRTRYQMRAERLGNTCRFYCMTRKD